jgi:hypothetical protein
MLCPFCNGNGCHHCTTEGVAIANYYVVQAVVSRQRQEAMDFLKQFMAAHGVQQMPDEGIIRLVMEAIQWGRQGYLDERQKELDFGDGARFDFIEL